MSAAPFPGRIIPRKVPAQESPPTASQNASAICMEAARLVDGDRAADYGDKLENHKNIARLWNAYLHGHPGELTAFDVAVMMALLKIARTKLGRRSMDTFVDICGYGSIAGEFVVSEK